MLVAIGRLYWEGRTLPRTLSSAPMLASLCNPECIFQLTLSVSQSFLSVSTSSFVTTGQSAAALPVPVRLVEHTSNIEVCVC